MIPVYIITVENVNTGSNLTNIDESKNNKMEEHILKKTILLGLITLDSKTVIIETGTTYANRIVFIKVRISISLTLK